MMMSVVGPPAIISVMIVSIAPMSMVMVITMIMMHRRARIC